MATFIACAGYAQTTDVVLKRAEFDSLVSQRDRYRGATIRYRQVIKDQNKTIANHSFELEELKYNLNILSDRNQKLHEEKYQMQDAFKTEILKEKEASKSVYEANRQLTNTVNQTRKWRSNVNVLRGGCALLAVTTVTLLFARAHP